MNKLMNKIPGGQSVMPGRKESAVWQVFSKVSEVEDPPLSYRCNHCGEVVAMNRLRTDRLNDHIKTC